MKREEGARNGKSTCGWARFELPSLRRATKARHQNKPGSAARAEEGGGWSRGWKRAGGKGEEKQRVWGPSSELDSGSWGTLSGGELLRFLPASSRPASLPAVRLVDVGEMQAELRDETGKAKRN
ncbi:unnamed protein product [Xylocopa violacea]|uniref:Uncharacterized protein n=1 Tax=Xylocopa violacea TaxID=135666 RepID=A0ABP1P326_XYLVO